MNPIHFNYDPKVDQITIYGVTYSGDVFRQLGGMLPVGSTFRLVKRENGVIAIQAGEEAK